MKNFCQRSILNCKPQKKNFKNKLLKWFMNMVFQWRLLKQWKQAQNKSNLNKFINLSLKMFKYLMSTTTNKLKNWSQTTTVLRWTTQRKKKITLIDQATRNSLNQFMNKVLLKTHTSLPMLLHLANKMQFSHRKKSHQLGSTLIAPSSRFFRNTLKNIHPKGNLTFHTLMRMYRQKTFFMLTNMWNLSANLLNLKNI